jgi:MFS family permease
MTEPIIVVPERQGVTAILQYPQYRLLWISAFSSYIGRWIDIVVVSWLVLEMTNSAFMVGLLGTCRFASMLLGPFCGAIADRFNRRRILIFVQLTYASASLIIMLLFFTSCLEIWHLFAFSTIGGFCYTFDFSTRYAVASNIVKSRHLTTAVSVMSMAVGISSCLGPLLGGSLLELINASGCFALMTSSFLLSFLMLLPVKTKAPEKPKTVESMWASFATGMRHVKNDRSLLALVFLATIVNFIILPYAFTLVPLFAGDILNVGASGYGQLVAAIGLGITIGSLAAGALPHALNKGKLVIVTMIVWSAILLVFAVSRLFPVSMFILVVAGAAQGMSIALILSLLLAWSPDEMRGRVSGVYAFTISTLLLGNLLTGAGSSLWSAPVMMVINGSVSGVITILIAIWAKALRHRSKAAD